MLFNKNQIKRKSDEQIQIKYGFKRKRAVMYIFYTKTYVKRTSTWEKLLGGT